MFAHEGCFQLMKLSSTHSPKLARLWRLMLALALLGGWFAVTGGGTLGCFVSQASLECRPCAPSGDCGPEFTCVGGICRPVKVGADEFVRCEVDAGNKPD